MKSKKGGVILMALAAIALGVCLFLVFGPKGRAELRVTDVSQTAIASTKAPWGMLWRTGSSYVVVRGNLDGVAKLHIYQDQNHSVTDLGPGKIYMKQGGSETWCKTLRVTYEPGTAKSGSLNISLLCGRKDLK